MLATAYRNALDGNDNLNWGQAFVFASGARNASGVAISALYVTKSALGINLMPGPSPLHDLLYWIVV